MTEATERRLVLLARYLGGAPSPSKLRRAARLVEADAELSEVLWAAAENLPGAAWRDVVEAVDAGCALGMLDLLVELGRDDPGRERGTGSGTGTR